MVRPMTNTIAIWLAALILGFVLLDALVLQTGATLFLARQGIDFLQWIAFWR